jgi:septal ring factor EnvC (AmiA/AmiB activator)
MVRQCAHVKKISQYLLILFLAHPFFVKAESVDDKIEAEVRHLQQLQKELKQKQRDFEQTKKAEQDVLFQLELIGKSLNAQQRELEIYEYNVKESEKKILALEREQSELNRKHLERKDQLNTRLAAIYKLGNLGYLRTLFTAGNYDELLQRVKYLNLIAKNDVVLIAQLDEDIKNLKGKKKELESFKEKATLYQEKVTKKKQEVEEQKAERTEFLAKLREDKTIYQNLISELEDSSKELESLITGLENERRKNQEISTNGDNILPKISPPIGKGRLIWPVKGRLITRFGKLKYPRTNTYTFYKGIDIEATEGTPIYAVMKGTVKYANWFKGYGNLIILDHGRNFYTLYAHADEIHVKVGDQIEQQQVLGKVGSTDSIKGPYLYFEIRVDGKSVDPLRWLGRG